MSKILEALENAQTDAHGGGPRSEEIGPRDGFVRDDPPVAAGQSRVSLDEEMVGLYQRLDALLPSGTTRTLEFIASREGEGTSTVAGEFARVSAARFKQRVLLLMMDVRSPAATPLGRGPEAGAPDAAEQAERRGRLDIAPLPPACLAVAYRGDSSEPAATWAHLRSAYDLILVDAPPATTSPQGLAVSRQVDGVVLVIEAEDTRWPVAERVRQSIERSGGRVLGVVLNKRRYHIPRWVYQRL